MKKSEAIIYKCRYEKTNITQKEFDELFFNKNIMLCRKVEKEYEDGNYSFENIAQEAAFLDTIAISYIKCLAQNSEQFSNYCFIIDDDHYKPIKLVSRSLNLLRQTKGDISFYYSPPETLSALYGNLGNYYIFQNRYCEAIRCFNKALFIDPKNGFLRFKKAFYAKQNLKYIYKFCSLDKLFHFFIDELLRAKKDETKDFDEDISSSINKSLFELYSLSTRYKNEKFLTKGDTNVYSRFINPVLDLIPLEKLSGEQDVILDCHLENDKYVELVEQYLMIRSEADMVFHGIYPKRHADRKISNLLIQLYSFFDKIAYFLNDYYHIEMKADSINIKRIFAFDNQIILKYKNPFLYAIYWLSSEYRIKKINEYIDPVFLNIDELRNTLEHRCEPIKNILSSSSLKSRYDKLEEIVHDLLIYLQMMMQYEERLSEDYKKNSREYICSYLETSLYDFFSSAYEKQ